MSLPKGLFEIDELARRINGTIVLIRGEPHYIKTVVSVEGNTCFCRGLTLKGDSTSINVDPNMISFKPDEIELYKFNVGYCNMTWDTTYLVPYFLSRRPSRGSQAQGIVFSHLEFSDEFYKEKYEPSGYNYLGTPGLRNMLLNIYPSLTEALDILTVHDPSKVKGVAFHRLYALGASDSGEYFPVFRRGRNIGNYDVTNKSLSLNKKNRFLIENTRFLLRSMLDVE